jgi:hypothetical protein
MSISVNSMGAVRGVKTSPVVYWYLIAGAVLLALAAGPVLHGDPGAHAGTAVGMIVP